MAKYDSVSFVISNNVARMKSSSTLKAMQSAMKLRDRGHEVIDLTVGEPDFPTPEFICDLAVEGLHKGFTKYTPSQGMKYFIEAVASFYNSYFAVDISTSEISASCGGKQAIFNAICSIINPGDEVLIPKPYWVSFPEIVNFCGGIPVFIDTEQNGFVITADQVKNAITPKTKLLILNSPNNPTGQVIPAEQIIQIIETCAERSIYVISDECYLFFVYPPAEVFSSAVLPKDLRYFVCIAGSFSKTFSMTGWRIGYTIANEQWTQAMIRLQSHSATHPTSFVQYACAKALTEKLGESLKAIDSMLKEYKRRRDWLIPELQKIDGISCQMPNGAFYAFIDVRNIMKGQGFKTSADVASYLIEKTHVVTTDGAGFGADGFLRISYATSLENLQVAVSKIKSAFK